MKQAKNIFRSILFCILLVISLLGINQLLMPKYTLRNSLWPTTATYRSFYKMKKDTVDVLFLGSSTAVNAFIPQEIYNEYGIRSYNLGSEQQSLFLSYYWLKEALRTQSPSVVVLDTRFIYNVHPDYPINTSEGLTRKCLDPMHWSSVKMEAVHEICRLDPEQSELSYYLTNLRFHSRWTDIDISDFDMSDLDAPLKGYGPIIVLGKDTYKPYVPQNTGAWMEYPERMMEYLQKITDLCKAEGIDLMLVSLPGNEMDEAADNVHTAFARENGIRYYNLCSKAYFEEIDAEPPGEDIVGHANVQGAVKISRFIGRLLRNVYHVQAAEDEQYESTREFYDEVKKSADLLMIKDPVRYLKALDTEKYTVFLMKDRNTVLNRRITTELTKNGISELSGKDAYCVKIENGVITEETIQGPVKFDGGKSSYTVSEGSEYTLVINGREYTSEGGLHVVVYDKNLGRVIDDAEIQQSRVVR